MFTCPNSLSLQFELTNCVILQTRYGLLGPRSIIRNSEMIVFDFHIFFPFFCRDIFQYLDEETQDAVFYQEEDESTFESVSLLAQKLEKEINHLFQNKSPTVLVGLMSTTKQVASHLIELSGNLNKLCLVFSLFYFFKELKMNFFKKDFILIP